MITSLDSYRLSERDGRTVYSSDRLVPRSQTQKRSAAPSGRDSQFCRFRRFAPEGEFCLEVGRREDRSGGNRGRSRPCLNSTGTIVAIPHLLCNCHMYVSRIIVKAKFLSQLKNLAPSYVEKF